MNFDFFALFFERGEHGVGFDKSVVIARFLAEFVHGFDIVDSAEQIFHGVEHRFDALHFGDDGLGGILVVPETVFGHFRFEFFFAGSFSGEVKESPGWR